MMSKKLFAFWKYDLFPHVLGGEVEKIFPNGNVEILSYGKGFVFTPIKILPKEDGQKLWEKINCLVSQRNDAQSKFNQEWSQKLKELISF